MRRQDKQEGWKRARRNDGSREKGGKKQKGDLSGTGLVVCNTKGRGGAEGSLLGRVSSGRKGMGVAPLHVEKPLGAFSP